jgi:predicted transcriptional regulator
MIGKTNKEVMKVEFASIREDSSLKEAFEAIKSNLEGPPHSPALVVFDKVGRCVGMLTMDDLMQELGRLSRDACDKPGQKDWADRFFNQCEIARLEKVSGIMSGKDIAVGPEAGFDQSCELLLSKNLHMLPVIEKGSSKAVGIITRRMVFEELGPRMFK